MKYKEEDETRCQKANTDKLLTRCKFGSETHLVHQKKNHPEAPTRAVAAAAASLRTLWSSFILSATEGFLRGVVVEIVEFPSTSLDENN